MRDKDSGGLKGRTLYIPRMTTSGCTLMAAAFRSVGIDAKPLPPSDDFTMRMGSECTSGEECYPQQITAGDILGVIAREKLDPAKTALFMPIAEGPCRFGQYATLIRKVLDARNFGDVMILSPTSEDGYRFDGMEGGDFERSAWRALVASDILRKLLYQTRPHEVNRGEADRAYEESLDELTRAIEIPYRNAANQLAALKRALILTRERFRQVAITRDDDKPLIGIVGEIFCRLNTFSNSNLVRRLEALGGEAWMSGVAEWVLYTKAEVERILRLRSKRLSKEMLVNKIKVGVIKRDLRAMLSLFSEEFKGREEPVDMARHLKFSDPYLPARGSLGEMTLSVANSIHFYHAGADGVIDISPFTCMNGIITEAIYPRLARDLGGIPIRAFYFDGTHSDVDRDLGIFLELAKGYRRRRKAAA